MTDPRERASEVTLGTHSGTGPSLAPVQVENFDEYLLVGKLGHGGMAEVFLALSQGPSGFRKLLVIKRLHTHLKDDPALVEMFLDEARLAARLSHPHVVQTNKVGSAKGHHFLAMEYLDGQPLNRILKRCSELEKPFPIALGARVLADALDGLSYAHEASDFDGTPLHIVHRDISPHNLFLTYDGQVKVLDFGIAKAATQEGNTRTGTIKGKFAYIAPEQARGERVDARADIWSMGVTMWEVLSGQRLFRRPTEVAVLQATLSEPIPFLTEVNNTIPRELAEICDRALQRDPEKRWPTARAMKDEVDEWIAAASKTSSRITLSAYLRETFATDVSEQRARIRACLGQASAGGRFPGVTASGEMSVGGVANLDVASLNPGVETRVEGRTGTTARHRAAAASPTLADPGPPPGPARGLYAAAAALVLLLVAGGAFWVGSTGSGTSVAPVVVRSLDPATTPMPAVATTTPVVLEPRTPAPAEPTVAPDPGEAIPTAAGSSAADETAATEGSEAPAPGGAVGGSRRRHRDREGTSPEEVSPEPTPEAVPPVRPDLPAEPAPAPGRLHLDCAPYAIVSFEGRRLGITPIDVELPAGAHTLTLRNPEAGIETTYRVTIRAGETTTRTVALE